MGISVSVEWYCIAIWIIVTGCEITCRKLYRVGSMELTEFEWFHITFWDQSSKYLV